MCYSLPSIKSKCVDITSDFDILKKLAEGEQLYGNGDFEGAISRFDEVIASNPNPMSLISAHGSRTAALRNLGGEEEAEEAKESQQSVREALKQRLETGSEEEVSAGKRTQPAAAKTEEYAVRKPSIAFLIISVVATVIGFALVGIGLLMGLLALVSFAFGGGIFFIFAMLPFALAVAFFFAAHLFWTSH